MNEFIFQNKYFYVTLANLSKTINKFGYKWDKMIQSFKENLIFCNFYLSTEFSEILIMFTFKAKGS